MYLQSQPYYSIILDRSVLNEHCYYWERIETGRPDSAVARVLRSPNRAREEEEESLM